VLLVPSSGSRAAVVTLARRNPNVLTRNPMVVAGVNSPGTSPQCVDAVMPTAVIAPRMKIPKFIQ
jgi:hypothetical protein